ncbi:hypothetical protein ES705_27729 [subsurface metagenome]
MVKKNPLSQHPQFVVLYLDHLLNLWFWLEKAELDSKIKGLESEKTTLATELEHLMDKHERLADAIRMLASTISYDEIRTKLDKELYAFLLKDSRVPDMVIDGVGKFIDFRKYLGMAAEKGAEVAGKHAEQTLSDMLKE